MQLFELKVDANEKIDGLELGKEIKPEKFQSILRGKDSKGKNQKSKESDMESLIVANPALLNYDESDFGSNDLLIISRQLTSKTNKRADLVALDKNGYLITIEIKRDAQDEKNRSECMEFQSIRYAANHRTLDKDRVINIYAEYLQKLKKFQDDKDVRIEECREEAVKNICKHLSDDDEISEDKLADYIDPTERQKIYLVAADFAPDCLSAVAWLREHHIDIYCFKLQPYKINNTWVLHQERLIPPVALDEFYIGTKEAKEKEKQEQGTRSASIKPVSLSWGDEEFQCNAWSQLFVLCVKQALKAGVSVDQLPCAHTYDKAVSESYYSPDTLTDNDQKEFYIDKHASRAQVEEWVKTLINAVPPEQKVDVRVELKDGTSLKFE